MSEPVIGKAFATYATSTTGDSALTGHPTVIVCEICGNKRCPHASDAGLLCTGSNADVQTGVIERSNANAAIAFLERELSEQMAKVESIRTALATVRSVAAEQAKEGRMV